MPLSIQLTLPDLWQADAVRALKAGRDVILDAPTGAGKTFVFEQYAKGGVKGGQAIYTVPTRALANDKRAEWREKGWNVGIATGDVAEDLDAPVIVATLETQRERLIQGRGPALLAVDEYQLIADRARGLNYELALALAPPSTQLLLLSGSVANPDDVAAWLRRLGARSMWCGPPSARCRSTNSASNNFRIRCRRRSKASGAAGGRRLDGGRRCRDFRSAAVRRGEDRAEDHAACCRPPTSG
ncbi:MAG: DEAD/DEAH box helicase [Verrucomicrobiales bacterium]